MLEVYPVVRAFPVDYRLRDLGNSAHHYWGGVLRDFTELVLPNVPARRLVLLVAALD